MAVDNHFRSIPGATSSGAITNLSFIKIDGDCTVGLAAAGEAVDGVSMCETTAAGEAVSNYGPGDLARVTAAAAIPAGSFVASDAAGLAVVAAPGNYIAGRAYSEAAAAGEVISVFLTMPGRLA